MRIRPRRHQITALIFLQFLTVILLLFPAGCAGSAPEPADPSVYTSLRDIPGVTAAELQAVAALREKYTAFTFGALGSTEAFYDENGEIRGYAALYCEWLTELFGISFVPEIYEWGELFPVLKADFTGDLTATEERRDNLGYLFTDAIAERSTRFFSIAGSQPRAEIIQTRPLKLAFLEGSTTSRAAEAKLRETAVPYEAVYINDYATAYRMIKSGEADAFIHEMVVEAAFDEMGDVVAEDFLPLIFEPVSLSTQNQELKPIIDIVQKVLLSGGITYLVDLYEQGMEEYARHKLFMRLTEQETAYLRENKAVRYLAEFDNYPLSFYNANDRQWQGIAPDILAEISGLTGLTFEPINQPGESFSALMKKLEDGEGAMLSEVIRNREREGRFLWPENINTSDYFAAVSREEMPNITVQRIMQLKIGVQKDSAYADLFNAWFPNHPYVTSFQDVDAAFQGLAKGEVDILMCSTRNLLSATNYHEMTGLKTNIVFDYAFESLFGFHQDEAVLCSIIDKTMDVIDIETISSQWLRKTFDYRAKILESQRPYLIGLIGLFFTVILLVFILYLRNRGSGRRLDLLVRQRTAELDHSRQDLSAALSSAEGANRAKSAFLATMSHEIRTPMNAIIGMAEIALREDIPNTAREHLFTIKQAGTNLLSIINDILDFSKIEAGKMEILPADYMLTSLLNDVISIIRMRTADSRVLFVVNADCNIPDALYGDEVRIRQILLNLLGNAVKFTEKGFISFTVFGETNGDTVTLSLSVTDTGKGIRPEDIGKLFENFSQVDSAHNKGIVGTGLGLAITRSLARAMGGEVSVLSEYGQGSTFTVTLPQKIRNHAPLAAVQGPAEKRVLVYDVREIYANSIICTIDNLGVNCTLVSTPSELRREMEKGGYDYVFIAANLYDGVRELCGNFAAGIKTVLLAGFGEVIARRNLSILAMPVYSTAVANLLNGVAESAMYNENSPSAIRFTAPGASVLIVDDIDTNLMVIQGLLMPYEMKLVLCNSGPDAITALSAKKFDLILMDYMMPDMNGIETTRLIRRNPENEPIPIIALTANAVTGAKEMFLAAGFNDYLSKPVDIPKLDALLEKWIPREKQQKYAAEAGGNPPKHFRPAHPAEPDPKLLAVFRRDAKKAAAVLRETMANGNLKLFTTTAHAMKSALGNIGEPENAELAFALEAAGQRGDLYYITSHGADFVKILERLSQSSLPAESPGQETAHVREDRELLAEQLLIIKAACADYDETAAYTALARLKEKSWEADTVSVLETIHDTLYLHSDFEEAGEHTDILLQRKEEK